MYQIKLLVSSVSLKIKSFSVDTQTEEKPLTALTALSVLVKILIPPTLDKFLSGIPLEFPRAKTRAAK